MWLPSCGKESAVQVQVASVNQSKSSVLNKSEEKKFIKIMLSKNVLLEIYVSTGNKDIIRCLLPTNVTLGSRQKGLRCHKGTVE